MSRRRLTSAWAVAALLWAALAHPAVAAPLAARDEPELPPGLQPASEPGPEEPELPPGLGEEGGVAAPREAAEEEPSLPLGLGGGEEAGGGEERARKASPWRELHGFWEARGGPRLGQDPAQPDDFTLAESRLQLEWTAPWKQVRLEARGDLVADAVSDDLEWDQRELQLSASLGESVDLKIGRQILTWGTGDLLFVNDLFPKDWVAFFIGRDSEYLKAPSDAVRLGWFPGGVQFDLVYTPQFDADRFIRGERISFWSPRGNAMGGAGSGGLVGQSQQVDAAVPDRWLEDDELAIRVYRSVHSFELALYGYDGFWKSPAGFDPDTSQATFPRLRVYGASARGPVGPGIASLELGFLDSRDDPSGASPLVANSEARLLVGYERELARELTGGFQYYVEQLLDYDAYLRTLGSGRPRDELRHVVTVRLTQLLMSQTLRLGVFAYASPSDRDAYLRPEVSYAWSDRWTVGAGGNWFLGEDDSTFFGQFENNSNVYVSIRASF